MRPTLHFFHEFCILAWLYMSLSSLSSMLKWSHEHQYFIRPQAVHMLVLSKLSLWLVCSVTKMGCFQSQDKAGICRACGWIKFGRWWLHFNMWEAPFAETSVDTEFKLSKGKQEDLDIRNAKDYFIEEEKVVPGQSLLCIVWKMFPWKETSLKDAWNHFWAPKVVLCAHSYLKMVLLRLKRTNLGIKTHRAFVCTLSNIFLWM